MLSKGVVSFCGVCNYEKKRMDVRKAFLWWRLQGTSGHEPEQGHNLLQPVREGETALNKAHRMKTLGCYLWMQYKDLRLLF